jgi:hypothetical protein
VPAQLIPFSVEAPKSFSALLCDGAALRGGNALAELLDAIDALATAHPHARILASLDNIGQAEYTSGHCIDACELDATDGHDLSGLDPACFDGGEHLGYLSTAGEFPIRLANLLAGSKAFAADDYRAVLPWSTDYADGYDLVSANCDHDAALELHLDCYSTLQIVPVTRAADALAAFPNGYFSSDLDPFANHALALHLEQTYGLMLCGVGARFLGFRREQPLSTEEAEQVAAELVAIYDEVPDFAAAQLTVALTGSRFVLLRYTEG